MLRDEHACWLVAPANAIPPVKEAVWREGGYVSDRLWDHRVADGLEAGCQTISVRGELLAWLGERKSECWHTSSR